MDINWHDMTSCMSVFLYSMLQKYNMLLWWYDTVNSQYSSKSVYSCIYCKHIYCVYLVYNAVQCTVEYSKQMVRESSSKVLLCRGSGHNWGWQRLLCCTLYSLYITVYTIIFIFELSVPGWQFWTFSQGKRVQLISFSCVNLMFDYLWKVWKRGHQMQPEPGDGLRGQ